MRTVLFGLALTTLALALAATATGTPAEPMAIPGCAKASLNLVEDGQLSPGDGQPGLPPVVDGRREVEGLGDHDPTTGKGYESAVAYAVAKQLGFTKAQVSWEAVPFMNSFAPGKKSFDFYIAQVSNRPERRKAVTFRTSYYVVNQAVVARRRTRSRRCARSPASRRTGSAPRSGRRATTTSSGSSSPIRHPACTTRSTTS